MEEMKFYLPLNLQLFADGDDDIDTSQETEDEDDSDGYDFDLGDGDDDEVEVDDEDDIDESDSESDEQEQESEVDSDTETAETEEKKAQTAEENARFAEQRRQQQLQQELEKMKQEAPEFKTAQLLSQLYGQPIDQVYAQLQQAALEQEAKDRGIPVEVVKQLQESQSKMSQLEQQTQKLQFQLWKNRVDSEAQKIKTDYPMLSDDDIASATSYLLTTLKNPEVPLEQAIYAVHGAKIIKGLQETAKTEALAEVSGRKNKSPLPRQGGKPSATTSGLDESERFFARQLGISDEEYLKNKG